jgi:hypothetical protein
MLPGLQVRILRAVEVLIIFQGVLQDNLIVVKQKLQKFQKSLFPKLEKLLRLAEMTYVHAGVEKNIRNVVV